MKKIFSYLKTTLLISVIAAFALNAPAALAQEEPAAALPIEEPAAPPASEAASVNEPAAATPVSEPAAEVAPSVEPQSQPEQETTLDNIASETAAAQKTINADINITAQDLGVSEPTILPDSRLYPVKEAWRGIKSFFTFGDVKRAERRLQYANEKLIETKKLAEKTDNPETIKEALENYKDELAEVKDRVADIKEKAEENSAVDKFLENFVDDNLKQQKLLDKIESESPSEVFGKLNEVKDEALNKFSEISLAVAKPEKLKEKFEKAANEQKGSEFKEFKNLEVLKQLEEKLPENAKEAIEKAQENMMEKFKEKMGEFSDDKKELFRGYIKNIPGRELKQMEVFHDFENGKMPEKVREIFQETKGLAMKKIEETMMNDGPKERQEMILKDLEGQKMKDVRIIKELEDNLAPEVIDKILAVKNRTLDNIRRQVEAADSPEKQQEFFREIEKFHDVKQLEMFKEMEQIIPPEKKEFFEKMKEKAMEEMKKDVGRASGAMEKKMIFQQMASDNPEAMSVIKEFGPPPEMMQEIMREQIAKLEQKIGNEQDAQKLMILKQRVEEDETVKNELEAKNPEIFKKIDARQTILNQGMNAETATQQIEKAKAELAQAINEYEAADQTFAQMNPARQLIEAAQKHIANAENLIADGKKPQHGWGQATAALHEANSVRRIVKEVDLRKEIGQKRQEEFKQKYEQMMTGQDNGANGAGYEFSESGDGQNQAANENSQSGGNKPRLVGPPIEFGNVDMMKCAMPQKLQCRGTVSMKKDENGCPQLSCEQRLEAAEPNRENQKSDFPSEKPSARQKETDDFNPAIIKERMMEKTMPQEMPKKNEIETFPRKINRDEINRETIKQKEAAEEFRQEQPKILRGPAESTPKIEVKPEVQNIAPQIVPEPVAPRSEPAPIMTQPQETQPTLNEPGSIYGAVKNWFR